MKRSIYVVSCLTLAFILAACGGGNAAAPTAANPTSTVAIGPATAAPTGAAANSTGSATDIVLEPANSTATPAPKGIQGTPQKGGSINGTAVATVPAFTPPATFADLLKQYPDLQPFIDKCQSFKPDDPNLCDFDQLYQKIMEVYKDKGATGVATFLKESGILEKMGIPVSYLDLLTVYDKGGFDAVKKLAKDERIINDKNEVVGYLAIDDQANVDAVKADLAKLLVTTYDYNADTSELEIGVSLDLLSKYQTPGTLIKFLSSIAQVNHVVGFRAPVPYTKSTENLQPAAGTVGAKTVGADKWWAAGITGKGVKVGILDMGFGGIQAELGKKLPAKVTANLDLSELDAQEENHGTAVAEIVYGIAPDVDMYIAYFDGTSESSFTDALDFLKQNQVQIINFSVGSSLGPRDGTFGDALVVDEYVKDTNVLWVNAAGNEAAGHTRFTYNDDGNGNNVFGTDKDGNQVTQLPFAAGVDQTTIIMDWNGSWDGKEKTEYDFTVTDQDGNQVASGAELRKGRKNDYPFQSTTFDTTPGNVYFVTVNQVRGSNNNTIDLFVHEGQFPDWADVPGYSISTPGDSDSALTVGATGLTQDKLEFYSSQGPTTDERTKPDISAPTGEKLDLTGFEDGFFGTSGSSPLVAGAAALVMQGYPDLSMPEVKALLEKSVKDLGDKGPDDQFGTGRLALGEPPSGSSNGSSNGGNNGGNNGNSGNSGNNGNTGSGSASIGDVNVKFNQTFKGKKGVKATVSFEVDNFKGQPGAVAILFYDKDGKTPLTPTDDNFTIGQTIGTGALLTPKNDQASFDNVVLFIPNSALAGIKGKKTITYIVAVLDLTDKNNPQVLAATGATPVNVK